MAETTTCIDQSLGYFKFQIIHLIKLKLLKTADLMTEIVSQSLHALLSGLNEHSR